MARPRTEGGRAGTRLLGELVLVREEYPRRGMSQAWIQELAGLLAQGLKWATPLVVDADEHLLDGWHRFEAYRRHDPEGWPLREVEVQVIDCAPEDRRYWAAALNRAHGRRLDDEEAAAVAAERARRLGGDDLREMRRQARRLARELAVDPQAVIALLFPEGAPRPRALPPLAPAPVVVHDPSCFTPPAILERAEWLADALEAAGTEVVRDPLGPRVLRRLWAVLDYLLASGP
jgi:hypothetical protein